MTTINGNMDATQTTVPVAAATLAPGFYTVDDENIEVLGAERGETVGDKWDRIGGIRHVNVTEPIAVLCVRGVGGSTAASHTSGATLTRYYPDAPGGEGGGGGLPTGWTQAGDPANVLTNNGRLTLGSDPNNSPYIDNGVIYRPDGTPAIAFDQPGRVELYYGDEDDGLALDIDADGDISFHDLVHTATTLLWDESEATWVFTGDVIYQGNNALGFNGGGIDMRDNDITNDGGVGTYRVKGFGMLQPAPGSTPEVPAIPDAQDVVDALVTLGLITQAAP